MENKPNLQAGMMAISSLLIISVVALAISISIALIGVGEAQNSLTYKKGAEAIKIAEGCIEEGLFRLRNDTNYNGSTLQVLDGSCTIVVTGVGNNRIISATGNISGPPQFVRQLRATVKRTGQSINLLSWQEI